jgi:nudix-type nucleoside diphosphatase (YffH/AdpP family)
MAGETPPPSFVKEGEEIMGFELLSEEILYRGKVFNLAKTHFRLDNGKELTYDLVKHHGAVVVIPVDGQDKMIFVRQFRIGAEQALLELPAGLLEEGEQAEECAIREVQEETGMAPGKIEKVGEFFMVPGYSTEKMQVFLATQLFESSLPMDEDEYIERVVIPVKEAYRMAREGELLDGKTLAALFLAYPKIFPEEM